MDIEPSRLRRGEAVAGLGGVVLLFSLFVTTWYGTTGPISPTAALLGASTSYNGWHALTDLRWLILITGALAIALAYFQATRRAPAIPVSLSVVVTVLALITVLFLIYRVLINVPGPDSVIDRKAGAYLGLISSVAILYGGYASLRQEGILPSDGPLDIPTVSPHGEAGPAAQGIPAAGPRGGTSS
ncbi:MAG TPA: hypothetical protein VGI87_16525 [Solirubrobacteraceae bacterium]|jgi:hypothetical protein